MLLSTGWNQKQYEDLVEKLGIVEQADVMAAFDNLPTGDRDDATQITFTLTLEQAAMIKNAIKDLLSEKYSDTDTGNSNRNGNAISHIVREWLDVRG